MYKSGSRRIQKYHHSQLPQNTDNEQGRVLSYMNSVLSAGTHPQKAADASPNAMVFPVYGEVTSVLSCDDPVASREWLSKQSGVYYESWEDWLATRSSSSLRSVEIAGNYLVSVATDIEDIPRALHRLRREATTFPGHIPEISDYALGSMDRFYRTQGLGIPQFVLAAFALPPSHIDRKNPVTITYTQFDSVADKMIFPALDYHGEGEFHEYVKRGHKLLLSTNTLNEVLGSVMHANTDAVPSEFSNAPRQFPVSVQDLRNPKSELEARAPNNDYIFDMAAIHTKLQGAQAEIEALLSVDTRQSRAYYERQKHVIEIMIKHLGRYGVLDYSNQPATTAQGFAESCYGDVFAIGDFLQEDIQG